MSEKFRNKYRISSARMKNYDYALNGAYFITIVTHNRDHFFGEIIDNKMKLNELGKIVQDEWFKTPQIRPDMNIIMDEFIVMPNHIHGIIFIGDNEFNTTRRDAMSGVSEKTNYQNKFGPQRKNISSIIRGFKSAVTRKSRMIETPSMASLQPFAWQSRFYDRIIRNENELNRIRQYIILNPERWHRDRNNDNDLWL